MPKLKHVLCSHVTLANLRVCVYKRPGVKFGQGREQNTFSGAGGCGRELSAGITIFGRGREWGYTLPRRREFTAPGIPVVSWNTRYSLTHHIWYN